MNAISQFREAIVRAGLIPPVEIIADGKLRRFSSNGKKGDDAGYYVLYTGRISAGMFGCWREGFQQNWRADIGRQLTPNEEHQHGELVTAMKKAREEEERAKRGQAAKWARQIIDAGQSASLGNPYLSRKGVKPTETLFELDVSEAQQILGYAPKAKGEYLVGRLLVVPIQTDGKLATLELIDGAGRKCALCGGKKAGGYWSASKLPKDTDGSGLTIMIGEGVATLLSARQSTDYIAIAALTSSNLPAVARIIRDRFPAARIVILADVGNGQDDAEKAAQGIGCARALPNFASLEGEKAPKDFNDLHLREGASIVLEQVILALNAGAHSKQSPAVVPTMTREAIISAVSAAVNKNEILQLGEVIAAQRLKPQDLVIVTEEYRNAFKILTGVGLTRADAKKILKPNKNRPISASQDPLPEWLNGWVYLTASERFYNMETGQSMSRNSFDSSLTRYVPLTESGTQPAASNEALNVYQIETADRTMYMPTKGPKFEFERLPVINSFLRSSLPVTADGIDDTGCAAIQIIRNHIRLILGGRDDQIQLLTDWLAWQVQHIGEKVRFAPIIKGIEGDGKSLIRDILVKAIGRSNVSSVSPAELVSQFNSYAEGVAVSVLEEVRMVGHNRYDILNAVKPLITNDVVKIVRKGRDGYESWNVTNYIAFTNFSDALPINDTDRRWWVIYTPWSNKVEMTEKVGKNLDEYFDILHSAIRFNGPAIRRWLLDWKISEQFKPNGHAPATEERDIMVSSGQSEEDDVLRELLEQGGEGFSKEVVCIPYLLAAYNATLLYGDAVKGQSLASPLRKLGLVKWKRMRWGGRPPQSVWLKNPVGVTEISVAAMLDSTVKKKSSPTAAEYTEYQS